MREALALARAGVGLVSPNPAVGCVIVKDGAIVGRGTHTYDGLKHAEVLALEDAGSDQSRGATAYLNLEPCSHFGRTPPCADALVKAGITRVVCAMQDPNPAVAGQGFLRLRAHGISVETGLLEQESKGLNESFAKWIRRSVPFVTLKAGMSLDGKIAPAPRSGAGRWITSEAARAHSQSLRHSHDAIVVGIGTVLADDPALTDRTALPRRRSLLRIVLDHALRTPPESQLVTTASCGDLLIVCDSTLAQAETAQVLRDAGADIMPLSSRDCFWHDLLTQLGALNITSILIEGGAGVYGSALQADIVDKVALYIAPAILSK